jgi:hypothetical protein
MEHVSMMAYIKNPPKMFKNFVPCQSRNLQVHEHECQSKPGVSWEDLH